MVEFQLEKIVIAGWDNFTASLVEQIKRIFPHCEILCTDPINPEIQEALRCNYLSPLPPQKEEIYANTQYLIINKDSKQIISYLENINTYIEAKTCIIDFQPIKSSHVDKVTSILEYPKNYISCFVFLDSAPTDFTIRGDIFRDKIVAVISDTSTSLLQEIRDFWNIFGAKIVPTSAEFFDEIIAETTQSISLLSHIFTHVLLQDSWADTLFFGFYNKELRSFLCPASKERCLCSPENVIDNATNIRHTISFLKRELDKLDKMIDNEEYLGLEKYFEESFQFKKRI